MKTVFLLAVYTVLTLFSCGTGGGPQSALLSQSAAILDGLARTPEDAIPDAVLNRPCVVVVASCRRVCLAAKESRAVASLMTVGVIRHSSPSLPMTSRYSATVAGTDPFCSEGGYCARAFVWGAAPGNSPCGGGRSAGPVLARGDRCAAEFASFELPHCERRISR